MNDNATCNEKTKQNKWEIVFEFELSINTSKVVDQLKNQLKLETKVGNEFHQFSAKFPHSVNN